MRIKRLALLPLAFLMLGPAFAGTQDINLSATVAESCIIGGGPAPEAATHDFYVSGGMLSGQGTTLTFAVACNKAASMTLSTVNAGLKTSGVVGASYVNKVDYTVSTSGVFPSVSLNTAQMPANFPNGGGAAYTSNSTGPVAGNMNVLIQTSGNQGPLVAGSYSDTLRIVVVPLP